MSRSEPASVTANDSASIAGTLQEFVQRVLYDSAGIAIDVKDVRSLVSSVTRLYAACSTKAGGEIVAIDETVSATDAVMLACALIRAHSLNPFDLALWYSLGSGRDRPGVLSDENPAEGQS